MAGSPADRRRTVAACALALVLVALVACGGKDTAAPSTTAGPPTTTAADLAPNASPGCGGAATSVRPGRTELVVPTPTGERRTFVDVPPAHDGRRPLPVVLDLHGYSEGAQVHLAFTKMSDLGAKEGFITVTPQGSGDVPYWNSFGRPTPDDVAFLTGLVDRIGSSYCTDRRRTYVDGMSNGAFMTSLLACGKSQVFAAAVAVAGLQFPDGCEGGVPIPVLAVHGTDDTFVKYEGGFGDGVRTLGVDPAMAATAGRNRSVPDAAAEWARRNGCAQETTERRIAADVQRLAWRECTAATELYVVEGGGHSWPGSDFSKGIADVVGRTTDSIDATKLAWEFFRSHPARG